MTAAAPPRGMTKGAAEALIELIDAVGIEEATRRLRAAAAQPAAEDPADWAACDEHETTYPLGGFCSDCDASCKKLSTCVLPNGHRGNCTWGRLDGPEADS